MFVYRQQSHLKKKKHVFQTKIQCGTSDKSNATSVPAFHVFLMWKQDKNGFRMS